VNEKPFWEESYKKGSIANTFANGKPSPEFNDLVKELPQNASVLDLGCGDGRNAIFLAENGFNVTAVDILKAGIEKLKKIAKDRGISVTTEVIDMRDFIFSTTYDLIISHGCLHLIKRKHWISLIDKIKNNTKTGGYNVVAVFTNKIPPPNDLKEFTIGLFDEGELFRFYQDWRIMSQQSYFLEDQHTGGIKHKHPINKLVAQKP